MNNRCFACMRPIQEGNVCGNCGYNNADAADPPSFVLPTGTLIKGRYLVGLAKEKNGESICYAGFDTLNSKRVLLREFYPGNLCSRDENLFVTVTPGAEIQFKALMTDYVELSRQLMQLPPNGAIVPLIDVLADNGTIYAIYDFIDGVTLNEYLRENGGELTWEEAESMFMPLFYGIKLLNANGVIHRGISLETIVVTKERELKLKGICTSAVRAINAELVPELYTGYAAPEQYQKCSSHGEWTDVYAISAVLYRVLTGTAPASSEGHEADMPVMNPRQINPKIPSSVAQAVIKGMAYDKSDRTRTIKDFITDLYSQPMRVQMDVHQPIPQPLKGKEKEGFRLPVWLIVVLIALPIMLIIFFMLYQALLGGGGDTSSAESIESEISSEMQSSDSVVDALTSDTSSEESEPQVETVVVSDFSGKFYEDIIATETYSKWFEFTKKEEYNETLQIGEVVSQSVEATKLVPIGTKIELIVSRGKQNILIPPLSDASGNPISPEVYQKYLTDNGLTVKIEKIDSLNVMSGEIDSLSVTEGEMIDREVTKQIVIYVAS